MEVLKRASYLRLRRHELERAGIQLPLGGLESSVYSGSGTPGATAQLHKLLPFTWESYVVNVEGKKKWMKFLEISCLNRLGLSGTFLDINVKMSSDQIASSQATF